MQNLCEYCVRRGYYNNYKIVNINQSIDDFRFN